MEQLEEKHEIEKRELEEKIKEILDDAQSKGKNERKRANQLAEKMRRELFEKQSNEMAELNDTLYDEIENNIMKGSIPNEETKSDAQISSKKSQKNSNRSRKKFMDKIKRMESTAEVNTSLAYDSELLALRDKLDMLGYKIVTVAGDGHCLFRAIAKCLSNAGVGFDDENAHLELRKRAASHIRKNREFFQDYALAYDDFDDHIDKIENTHEWGDSLEVHALADALNIKINIVTKDSDYSFGDGNPQILLAYIKNYCVSGGHYNAAIPDTT